MTSHHQQQQQQQPTNSPLRHSVCMQALGAMDQYGTGGTRRIRVCEHARAADRTHAQSSNWVAAAIEWMNTYVHSRHLDDTILTVFTVYHGSESRWVFDADGKLRLSGTESTVGSVMITALCNIVERAYSCSHCIRKQTPARFFIAYNSITSIDRQEAEIRPQSKYKS
jgi:hypothetical protein